MKKYLLGLFAVVIAAGAVAFTRAPQKAGSPYACQWYFYTGATSGNTAPTTEAEAKKQTNYRVATSSDLAICTSSERLCAICANPDTRTGHSGEPFIVSTEVIDAKIHDYYVTTPGAGIPGFLIEKP